MLGNHTADGSRGRQILTEVVRCVDESMIASIASSVVGDIILMTVKRKSHQPLYALVMHYIQQGFSPEVISGRLKREYKSGLRPCKPLYVTAFGDFPSLNELC